MVELLERDEEARRVAEERRAAARPGAEKELKAAMPGAFSRADPTRLRSAITEARHYGVDAVLIRKAEAALKKALKKAEVALEKAEAKAKRDKE